VGTTFLPVFTFPQLLPVNLATKIRQSTEGFVRLSDDTFWGWVLVHSWGRRGDTGLGRSSSIDPTGRILIEENKLNIAPILLIFYVLADVFLVIEFTL
jgi:hypothetical protein